MFEGKWKKTVEYSDSPLAWKHLSLMSCVFAVANVFVGDYLASAPWIVAAIAQYNVYREKVR